MIRLRSEKLSVGILEKGAELCSVKDASGHEFMWRCDQNIWPRHAPVLFPIVGRLKDGRYIHEGKTYELPQHGFARDMDFLPKERHASSCVLILNSGETTRKSFPFDFQLETGYQLNGDLLRVKYRVSNLSGSEMYFSIGAHPGFALPLETGSRYEDHYLEFEQDEICFTALESGLLSGSHRGARLGERRLSLNENMFANDALILENAQVNSITLGCEASNRKIRMECKDWPFFGIWSKPGCKDFICLEPWHGITDEVNANGEIRKKKGVIRLSQGAVFECSYSMRFIS